MSALLYLVTMFLWVAPPPATPGPAVTEVIWEPSRPVQGSIVRIALRAAAIRPADESVVVVRGTFAGQPVHFELGVDGVFTAVGAIPLSAGDTLPLALTLDYHTGARRHLTVQVPVARGAFPTERLRVDSRFSRPPNAALARRIARERARSRAAWQHSFSTPKQWREPFIRPRPTRITSAYGLGRVFNGRVRSRHMGTDFDGERGDPVLAANRGIVRLTGHFYYGGRLVYLDHGRGLLTAYLHLSQIDVAEGDLVERGQVIGKVGATGRVTGPHLHWIARYGAVAANPMSLLVLGSPGLQADAAQPD